MYRIFSRLILLSCLFQQMLSTVLNIIMFEDCRNQWSMSRPLLGLILLNEEYFQSLRDQVCVVFCLHFFVSYLFTFFFIKFQIIQSQSAAKQSSMATWFKNLMDGVERNLLTKNRDK